LVDTVRIARLADIVIDCVHPAALARFWAASLDGYAVGAYDDEELERLRSIGIEDPEEDPSVLVVATSDRPRLWFQRVPEPKQSKNRVISICAPMTSIVRRPGWRHAARLC
jgi:hypothetical protein